MTTQKNSREATGRPQGGHREARNNGILSHNNDVLRAKYGQRVNDLHRAVDVRVCRVGRTRVGAHGPGLLVSEHLSQDGCSALEDGQSMGGTAQGYGHSTGAWAHHRGMGIAQGYGGHSTGVCRAQDAISSSLWSAMRQVASPKLTAR